MRARTVRAWSLVHTWTSLVATTFLLVLCVTGLPLIFHVEIDAWLDPVPAQTGTPPGGSMPSLDSIVAAALEKHPGDVPISLGFLQDWPAVVVQSAPDVRSTFKDSHRTTFDLSTGLPSNARDQVRGRLTTFLRDLHTELFLGLPGELFLGAMALLFLAAIVSGVVLYAPFMRRLEFGTVRTRSSRMRRLDLHNLIGIATMIWLLVVGATGAINTLHDIVAAQVRTEIIRMARSHSGPPPAKRTSVDAAIATGRKALPGGSLISFFFPGAGFATPHHYAVFARGDRPITSKLFYAALVDAETGELADVFEMPWYAKALLLSQPLHFGDYGGLPLKIIWALFDVAAIVVLISGVYLWFSRRTSNALSSARRRGLQAGAQ